MQITSSMASHNHKLAPDFEVWEGLKQAIALSSGFKRWQQEQIIDNQLSQHTLEEQVRLYLQATLKTLAY
jgi:hypothetical protein